MDTDIDIKFLVGAGPKRAELLQKELNINSLEDLLYYFPYRYVDRSRIFYIHEIDGNTQYVQLKGKLSNCTKAGEGRTARLTARLTDATGTIELVWFKGIKYIEDKYKAGKEYIVFGKPTEFDHAFNIVHPEIEEYNPDNTQREMGLQALYNTTEKMKNNFLNSKALQKIMHSAVQRIIRQPLAETLPAYIIEQNHLLLLNTAIINIHFPKNTQLLTKAQQRLKFEELFYIQLSILQKGKMREQAYKGFVFEKIGHFFNTFYEKHLPFELTNAQKRVLREIRADVRSGRQMNRLLQGDVGSGKTLVALMAMLMAADNGYQAAIMAPTEILATQHFNSICELLGDLGINVALLTGSTRKKDRKTIDERLQSGELHILIGTHALIEETVVFQNLGLVIIDEQHRFGVEQRSRLWRKNDQPPHILVMTATPIPRTLAMTIYGDLRISVIDELPPGRKPIQTYHYFDNKRNALNGFLRKQIELGRQVYVVYPLIQESEKIDLKNLEEGFEYMKEAFPEYHISMLHGKMRPAEKDAEMQRFVKGETQIMVATTVIEVGVNVPNASVMVIENAERFGLSQLHQLRGRVGRGADQSYCLLMSGFKLGEDTRKRLQIMVDSNDGFEIAEADLKMRGPGDMDGTVQSGLPFDLKIANLAHDGKMLEYTRHIAAQILERDPQLQQPENNILVSRMEKLKRDKMNWGAIS
ncbi:MAG: ATP-dependent DNA helicase RecG [Prevotellaceae bacterium]|nr:ATP-dependent DNA helicase RecG [Prevotellaceae bacterium]